jgi:hypothetical protein
VPRSILITSMFAGALCLAQGCDKSDADADAQPKKDAATKAAKADAPKADAPAQDDGPFAAFDLPGLTKKWQGAWVIDGGRKAWEVRGDEVTVYDGKGDAKTLEFEVQAPCQAASIERSDAGSSSTFHKFAFDGDTLYAGLGNAGVKKDDTVVACVSNKVYVLEGDACRAWKQSAFDKSKWESSDATCSLSSDGDTQTFEVEGTTLEVVGEAVVDAQMKRNQAERKPSFDDAKAALTR